MKTAEEIRAAVADDTLTIEGAMCARDGVIVCACSLCPHTSTHELGEHNPRVARDAYDALCLHLIEHGYERPTVRFLSTHVTTINVDWGREL